MLKLECIMKRLWRATSMRGKHPRLPITLTMLCKLKVSWERLPCCKDAIWAVSCFCFLLFLRTGEVIVSSDSSYDPEVHLNFEEVRVHSRSHPQWLEIRIIVTKRTHSGKGSQFTRELTGRWLCPVAVGFVPTWSSVWPSQASCSF